MADSTAVKADSTILGYILHTAVWKHQAQCYAVLFSNLPAVLVMSGGWSRFSRMYGDNPELVEHD